VDDQTLSVFELPNAKSGEAYLCELVSADRVAPWNVVNQVVADEGLRRDAHAFATRLSRVGVIDVHRTISGSFEKR
jgi:hypothetical protein